MFSKTQLDYIAHVIGQIKFGVMQVKEHELALSVLQVIEKNKATVAEEKEDDGQD